MKKILIVIAMLALVFSVSAQKFYTGRYYSRPRVVVTTGIYSPFYPYGYPFYPYPYSVYPAIPTRLELKIEKIRNDYNDKIWSARHDKTLGRKERNATVHELKHERDQAVLDAKSNYYKTKQ